jgi:hypothetical protein
MAEGLSYAEMKSRFDSEWVLVGDPDTAPDLSVRSGTVLFHSKDRDEVHRKARELRPKHTAILYLGRLPEDAGVIL